jgi:hypothetical protein
MSVFARSLRPARRATLSSLDTVRRTACEKQRDEADWNRLRFADEAQRLEAEDAALDPIKRLADIF